MPLGGLVPVCLVGAEAACLTGPGGRGGHTDPQAGPQQRRGEGLCVPHSVTDGAQGSTLAWENGSVTSAGLSFFLCKMGVMTPPLEGAVRFQA